MHQRARDYLQRYWAPDSCSVIEIGSRYYNGTAREYWPNAVWHGLDIVPGRCVDQVIDATQYNPPALVDLVVCCEVLEHTAKWESIVRCGCKWLKPRGRIIVTCAGPGRKVHGANGGALREGEWYQNIDPAALYDVMIAAGMAVDSLELFETDTRASGIRL